MPFRTLSERQASSETPTLVDGVPAWLRTTIVEFVKSGVVSTFNVGGSRTTRAFDPAQVRRLERLTKLNGLMDGSRAAPEQYNFGVNLLALPEEDLLRLLDEVVRTSKFQIPTINTALREAGSAYEARQVTFEGQEAWALERRVSPDTQEAMGRLLKLPRVGNEIQAARQAIFGLKPNPTLGLQHCVKAVEAAGLPVVTPSDGKGTLGSLAGELKAKPALFTVGIRGLPIGTVEAMCRALWDTEKPHRHGTGPAHAPTPPTQDEAEASFSLCLVLVEWFAKGVVKRL